MSGVAGSVAVGGHLENGVEHPSIWTADGKRWTDVPGVTLPPGLVSGSLTQLLSKDGTLVALGTASSGSQTYVFSLTSTMPGRPGWRPCCPRRVPSPPRPSRPPASSPPGSSVAG